MADNEKIEKLKLLLKDLFQFDNSDLDFGIYRIINIKRKEIAEFIDKELFDIINEKIKTLGDNTELKENMEAMQKNIEENFGCNIHEAKIKYAETPKVKDYLHKEKELKATEKESEIEEQIYNDIINFFSRYYDKGDFISKRRYSKDNKYAIPYNGEEVYLYWANNDQYYIKTGENFKAYSFKAGSLKVSFEIMSEEVEVEKGNIKDPEKKYFIFKDAEYDTTKKLVTAQFGYRGITDEETNTILALSEKKSVGKDEVNLYNLKKINERLGLYGLSELQKKHRKMDGKESEKSELEWHLNKYTTKNTTDYFIHKNLKRFFVQELNFFIKNEMLNIDDIESREGLDVNLNKIKAFKEISLKIIEFLAQIENFQKKLWEKRKFVISTDYCMTLDYVDEKYYSKILENKGQLLEWANLYSFDIGKEAELLKGKLTGQGKSESERMIEALKLNPTLAIDTKFYDIDFKYQLLSEIDDLDEKTNGILINSENFQALNLLMNKYREKVKCCYIDPPFNLGENGDFLYKTNYLDSSWCCLLESRIQLLKELLHDKGNLFVRCDYHGNYLVRVLLKTIFGDDNFKNEIIINRIKKSDSRAKRYNVATDTLYWTSKTEDNIFNIQKFEKERDARWHAMDSQGQGKPSFIIGKLRDPPKGRHWTFGQDKIKELEAENRIRVTETGTVQYLIDPTSHQIFDSNWTDIPGYSNTTGFSTENSEILLERVINTGSEKDDFVIDFFLGSGTTTSVAHKIGRKWIGVEMGTYFEEFPLNRMKQVVFGLSAGISKNISYKGGGLFKYQSLEQYEDSLNNINFTETNVIAKESKDYKIKYMLEFESKGSKVFLNLEALDNPFEYKLKFEDNNEQKEKNIDLVETFNYLAGITVKSIKKMANGLITYVIVKGYRNEKDVIVIWRNKPDGFDPEKDKEFIEKEILKEEYDEILVNGNSLVKDAKSIDEIFKTNMFG